MCVVEPPTLAAAAAAAPRPLDPLLALIEDHRKHDHRALDHDLPEGQNPDDHEAVGEEADDEVRRSARRGRFRGRP